MVIKFKLFELILFCYILILSLVPMTEAKFSIFALLIITPILPLALARRKNKAAVPVFCWFLFILSWALITTLFHHYFTDMKYILFPIFLAFLAMLIPFLFSKLTANGDIDVRKHIFTFSVIITICTTLYAIRGYAHSGFLRLASPIGGSAVIHVALLLTLSVYLANLKVGIKKVSSSWLTLVTVAMIILTESRAGLLTMLLLFLVVVITRRNFARSIILTIFLICVCYLAFRLLPTDRLGSIDSPARSIAFQTSIHIATSSFNNFVFGVGHGTIWPWYAYTSGGLIRLSSLTDTEFIDSPYGLLLVHPHSVFLGLITELGLVGLIPFLIIVIIIFKKFLTSVKLGNQFNTVIVYGVLCTLPSFFLDYYLFINVVVSTIWWYFLFFIMSVNYSNHTNIVLSSSIQRG